MDALEFYIGEAEAVLVGSRSVGETQSERITALEEAIRNIITAFDAETNQED